MRYTVRLCKIRSGLNYFSFKPDIRANRELHQCFLFFNYERRSQSESRKAEFCPSFTAHFVIIARSTLFFFNARIYHLQMRYFRSPNSLLRARSGASLLYFHSDKPLNDITVYAHQMQLVQSNRYVRMCIHVVLTLLAALATVVIFVIYYDGLSVGESCSPTKSFARRINSYGA